MTNGKTLLSGDSALGLEKQWIITNEVIFADQAAVSLSGSSSIINTTDGLILLDEGSPKPFLVANSSRGTTLINLGLSLIHI